MWLDNILDFCINQIGAVACHNLAGKKSANFNIPYCKMAATTTTTKKQNNSKAITDSKWICVRLVWAEESDSYVVILQYNIHPKRSSKINATSDYLSTGTWRLTCFVLTTNQISNGNVLIFKYTLWRHL